MQRFLSVLLIILSAGISFGQDSVNFTISGTVYARNLDTPVKSPKVKLLINYDKTYFNIGQTDGTYKISGRLPKKQLTKLVFRLEAGQHYSEEHIVEIKAKKDLVYTQDLYMIPKMECWDSELPNKIHFDNNSAKLNSALENHYRGVFPLLMKSQSHMLDSFMIEISAYADYSESEEIAMERAEYVKKLLLESGFTDSNVTINVEGKKNFFYCLYCEGCHYYYQKGSGIDLKPSFYNTVSDEESEYYHSLRRVVTLFWVKR